MSVLIKGMKMPKSCDECIFKMFECRKCPLVEVPPHGKLIDADKVVKKMEKIATKAWQEKLSDTVEHTLNMSMDILDDAPTVIESEEEK